ncbi:MAG: hypothetical protein EBX41_02545 [Chitinophagia bacterium]|nr:hypothetical protein [Chitinophagia bacterium]
MEQHTHEAANAHNEHHTNGHSDHAHGHDDAQHERAKSKGSFISSFWLVVILAGLFIAALNFIQVVQNEHSEGEGTHHEATHHGGGHEANHHGSEAPHEGGHEANHGGGEAPHEGGHEGH